MEEPEVRRMDGVGDADEHQLVVKGTRGKTRKVSVKKESQ